jgi:uncharacterized protein (DUF736 family)
VPRSAGPQRRLSNFLPLRSRAFLAHQQSSSDGVLRSAAVRSGCGANRFRPVDRHRGRGGRGLIRQNGDFKRPASVPSRKSATSSKVRSSPSACRPRPCASPEASRASGNAPSHRVFVGKAEIGAAWSKRSNEGRNYLSVKLDDPSFTQPIYANLFDAEDGSGYSLIWSRSRKTGAD